MIRTHRFRLALVLALLGCPGCGLGGGSGEPICIGGELPQLGTCFTTHPQPPTLGGVAPADGAHLLDPGFGDGGEVAEWNLQQSGENRFDDVVVDRFGRALVTGARARSAVMPSGLVVQRYDATGARDASFGEEGRFRLASELNGGIGVALAIDSADRIWVAGTTPVSGPPGSGVRERATLLRLLPDGTLDPEFGVAGVVRIPEPEAAWDSEALDFTLDPQGRVVLLGAGLAPRPDGEDPRDLLAAFTADGELDATFGQAGFAYEPAQRAARARALARDSVGRWLVAGELLGAASEAALWRFTAVGTPDPAFGVGGLATVAHTTLELQAVAVTPDGGGNLLVAGNRASDLTDIEHWPYQLFNGAQDGSPVFDVVVWCFDASGVLVPGFGDGGSGAAAVNVSAVEGDYFDVATAIGLDAAGRILVTGFSDRPMWEGSTGYFVYNSTQAALFRFTPGGQLDGSFNGGGVALLARERAEALAFDVDGRLLLPGLERDSAKLWRVLP